MGIPGFYGGWVRRRPYPGLLQPRLPPNVASLSIDMNSLIHKCAQLVYAYGDHADPIRSKLVATADPAYLEMELHQTIATAIMNLYSQVRPSEVLCLAVDGVAPRAKINQQRQRRYRAAQNPQSAAFDTNAVTPGTDFMMRLDNFLQRWLLTNQLTLAPKILYSSHKVPGEGEHKIFDFMRNGDILDTGAHVLHGLDADLFMLSMVAPFDNIFLMREEERNVVSISALKRGINGELGTISGYNDFVVMMYLVGNDFLPAAPALEEIVHSVDLLMQVYRETRADNPETFTGLTRGDDIDWPNLGLFLAKLAAREPSLMTQISQRDYRFPSPMIEGATTRIQEVGRPLRRSFNFDTFRGLWYANALGAKGDAAFGAKFNGGETPYQVSNDRIVAMALNYLTGLAWNFLYYKRGTMAVNASYLYRHYHAPLFLDLAMLVQQYPGQYLGPHAVQEDQPMFGMAEQLLAVLPPRSVRLLPIELQPLMADSLIADMFPLKFIVEVYGRNDERHGLVLLPPVESERLVSAVQGVAWVPERAAQYQTGDNLIVVREASVAEAMQRQAALQARLAPEPRPEGEFRPRGEQRGEQRGEYRPRGDFRGRGRGRGEQRGGDYRGEQRGRGRGTYRGRGGDQPRTGLPPPPRPRLDAGAPVFQPAWTNPSLFL